MPTYEVLPKFWRDFRQLTPSQQEAFLSAVEKFVKDLRAGKLRKALRVKAVRGAPSIFEMTWAPDGRATFQYGDPAVRGEIHVVWRRCGTHRILGTP